MATILFINNEHCTSVDQLKEYFSMELTPESDIYADLLDYGRHGDIAKWLHEMGELELASKVETIAPDLIDSVFYARLKAAITSIPIPDDDIEPLRPTFDKCFSFEGVKCDVKDYEAKVIVSLKVLMCVNENYELSVSSNWGMRGMIINPSSHPEGKTDRFDFTFHKRPGKDIGEIIVMADGTVLSDEKVRSKTVENNCEYLVGDVRFKMIHVEGDTFTMGATPEQGCDAKEDEKPAHQVTLSSYSIGETPVTQELWQAVMGTNPSYYKGPQRPVENVSWNDCQEFIRKLYQKTGKQFRLPTEAEWEFAARGGKNSRGYKFSGSNNLSEVAWFGENSSHKTHPVKEKKPNELGIYDMSGNVWEWCQDWYDDNYYNNSRGKDPKGPRIGSYRVSRGGSWFRSWYPDTRYCRLSHRNGGYPDNRETYYGLRLALSELRTSV